MTTAIAPVNGIEIGYETHGDPDDEPLLLVMGLGAQLIAWPVELCDALVDRGFFVIRYDNRDTGLSTQFEGGDVAALLAALAAMSEDLLGDVPYTLSAMAADGMALLTHLGIESAHIVGASMGGMIAQAMAIEHPERVRTLTSIMSMTGELEYGQPTPEALAILVQPAASSREEVIEADVVASRVIASPEHLRELGEISPRLRLRAQVRGFFLHRRVVFPLGLQEDVAGAHLLGRRVLLLIVFVIPLHILL